MCERGCNVKIKKNVKKFLVKKMETFTFAKSIIKKTCALLTRYDFSKIKK
jgi:hypothetical protein